MDATLANSIWQQYGASIDMVENAIKNCPDELWTGAILNNSKDVRYGQFWYIAYHTLECVDMYLTGSLEAFKPPAPFIQDVLPEKPHTKDEILTYLQYCRDKCQTVITSITSEQANRICTFDWIKVTFTELQLYAMRHTQEHAAQMGLFLAQHNAPTLDWVTVAEEKND